MTLDRGALAAVVCIPLASLALVAAPAGLTPPESPLRTSTGRVLGAAVLTGIGAAAWFLTQERGPSGRLTLALGLVVLAATGVFDALFLLIPDLFSAALALLGVVWPDGPDLTDRLLGALACSGLLLGVRWAWRRARAEEGLGFGDVKLAAALGLWTGLERGLYLITAAATLGAIYGLVQRARSGPAPETAPLLIPFGAALAAVGAVVILSGPPRV